MPTYYESILGQQGELSMSLARLTTLESPLAVILVFTEWSTLFSNPNGNHSIPSDFDDFRSAQSQVLADPDLLGEIISFDDLYYSGDLLPISLTCKNFLEPCMDALWECIENYDHWVCLIKSIPSVSEEDDKLVTNNIVREKHLNRFDYYARRVKKIEMSGDFINAVSVDIFAFITLYRQFNTFPILQSLDFDFEDARTLSLSPFFLFASETLSTLALRNVESSFNFLASSLLHSVFIKSRRLVDLTLFGDLSCSILDIVPGFQKIQRLNIFQGHGESNFIMELLSNTTNFESLNYLSITVVSWEDYPGTAITQLETLRELEISGPRAFMYYVLGSVQTVQLTHLDIRLIQNYTEDTRGPFEWIEKLPTVVPWVQCVTLHFGVRGPVELPRNFFPSTLTCKQLREVTSQGILDTGHLISLAATGERWPSVEVIDLQGSSGRFGTTPCLLSQIDLFAASFPNLRKLSIAVSFGMNSDEVQHMSARDTKKHSCHKLESLRLYRVIGPKPLNLEDEGYNQRCREEFGPLAGNIDDLVLASQFINHTFPHLQKFHIDNMFCVDKKWRTALEVGVKSAMQSRSNGTKNCSCST